MLVRLVHLLNEQKRRELMIICAEDLAPTGFTAADLQKGGKARNQWPAIEKGLIAFERFFERLHDEPEHAAPRAENCVPSGRFPRQPERAD